jgi:drug/metabolite transporter (DMT)-like permease
VRNVSPVKRYLPWIALVAVWILWGSTYTAIRVAVETIPPYLMVGTRYIIAGILLGALQWAFLKTKPSMPTPAQLGRIAITAVLLLVIGNGILCLAETRVPSAVAALIVASTPIWMLIFESIRTRTMMSWASIAGLLIGSAGMVVLVGQQSGSANLFYAVLILLGSIAWALGSIYSRGTSNHHPLTAPLEMLAGGFIAVIVGFALGEGSHFSFAAVTAQSVWGMVWLITGGAMAGYTAYSYIVRTLPASTVATYGYVNPIVAVILGAVVLHEPVTLTVIAGGAAVILSVVVILLGNRRKQDEDISMDLAEDAVA